MKSFITILMSLFMVAFISFPAHAAWLPVTGTLGSTATNCGSYNTEAATDSVYMVGDSITAMGRDELNDLRHWEVNALGGRTVDCLPGHLNRRIDRDVWMTKFVVALGTNAILGWDEADYRQVITTLRQSYPRAVVVFVTTYRDPDKFNEANGYKYRGLASTQYWISRWMRNIADDTAHVCLADWRTYVANKEYLLSDGVHPNAEGQKRWASLVVNAVANCNNLS